MVFPCLQLTICSYFLSDVCFSSIVVVDLSGHFDQFNYGFEDGNCHSYIRTITKSTLSQILFAYCRCQAECWEQWLIQLMQRRTGRKGGDKGKAVCNVLSPERSFVLDRKSKKIWESLTNTCVTVLLICLIVLLSISGPLSLHCSDLYVVPECSGRQFQQKRCF